MAGRQHIENKSQQIGECFPLIWGSKNTGVEFDNTDIFGIFTE